MTRLGDCGVGGLNTSKFTCCTDVCLENSCKSTLSIISIGNSSGNCIRSTKLSKSDKPENCVKRLSEVLGYVSEPVKLLSKFL